MHRCSSHPSQLSAEVIIYEDSQMKQDGMFHGVGYSPGSHGHELVSWLPLTLSNNQSPQQQATTGPLAQFSSARPGHLPTTPKKSLSRKTAAQCASECLELSTCRSFAHEPTLLLCEIFEITESEDTQRKLDRNFVSYERLGVRNTARLRYDNLPLRHGTAYFINVDVQNVLGYRALLSSEGTMVDFSPPHPGHVGDVVSDVFVAGGCQISILQRCVNAVNSSLNHR